MLRHIQKSGLRVKDFPSKPLFYNLFVSKVWKGLVVGQSLTKIWIYNQIKHLPLPAMEGFYITQQVFASSLQDETLNGTGCEKSAAVWMHWNPKCYMQWLTWRWMGVNAVSSYFPPRILLRENLKLGMKHKTTQSFSAKVMDHTERLPSCKWIQMENVEDSFCLLFSLIFALSCVVFCTVSINGGQRMRLNDCTVAVLVTDVLYVQSEATLGNSRLCVSRSPRAKCYTGRTVAHRTFVSSDAGICLTGATHGGCKPSEGWSATRDLQPVTHGKV